MAKYISMAAIKAAIEKKAKEAVSEAVEKTYNDALSAVSEFYGGPSGRVYIRTGALG